MLTLCAGSVADASSRDADAALVAPERFGRAAAGVDVRAFAFRSARGRPIVTTRGERGETNHDGS